MTTDEERALAVRLSQALALALEDEVIAILEERGEEQVPIFLPINALLGLLARHVDAVEPMDSRAGLWQHIGGLALDNARKCRS